MILGRRASYHVPLCVLRAGPVVKLVRCHRWTLQQVLSQREWLLRPKQQSRLPRLLLRLRLQEEHPCVALVSRLIPAKLPSRLHRPFLIGAATMKVIAEVFLIILLIWCRECFDILEHIRIAGLIKEMADVRKKVYLLDGVDCSTESPPKKHLRCHCVFVRLLRQMF